MVCQSSLLFLNNNPLYLSWRSAEADRFSFTLSGWAKGYGLPNYEREGITAPTFKHRGTVLLNTEGRFSCVDKKGELRYTVTG